VREKPRAGERKTGGSRGGRKNMEIRYLAPLSSSWDRCKTILFRPFDLWKWLVLGFSAWLAGVFRGGGGGAQFRKGAGGPENLGKAVQGAGEAIQESVHQVMSLPWTSFLILFGVLAALLIVVALLWVSSRGKLIFLDNVVTNRAQIVEPWKRLGRLGDSLFLWRLGFGVASMLVILLLVGGAVGGAVLLAAGKHVGAAGVVVAMMFALVVAAVAIAIAFIAMCVENFVVPIMYRFNLTVLEAWRHFLPWLQRYLAAFIAYWLFVILLAIVVGMAVVVVGLMTCCFGFLLVWLPYIGTVVLLPVWVTYRSLGPEFLAQLDPELAVFVDPAPEKETEAGEV